MSAGLRVVKLTHREHVLHRPGMYLGSTSPELMDAWVMDAGAGRMRQRAITITPALLKCLDEVLTNALDHATRVREAMRAPAPSPDGAGARRHHPVRRIDMRIDRATGILEVVNDGDGVPVERHGGGDDAAAPYVPEVVFGQLLTSTNYDDTQDREVAGTNGLGAKLANVFARWFEVRTTDAARRLTFSQRYEDNMAVAQPPVVTRAPASGAASRPGTSIRWLPDYARLGLPAGLTDDMVAILEKRAYDAAAVVGAEVSVYLNDARLDVRDFQRYADLYLGDKAAPGGGRAYEAPAEGWEVVAGLNEAGDGLQQVSFVNGVATLRGGKHVDHVVNQVCRKLADAIAAKVAKGSSKRGAAAKGSSSSSDAAAAAASGGGVRPQFIRDNLFVLLRATVPNPTFDSQSKHTLTTPPAQFGARGGAGRGGAIELSDKFIDKLAKLDGLVDRVTALSEAAAGRTARKTDGAKRSTLYGIPKLDDAEWAGTARSAQCTLILTEGESAKASAIAGLAVVGRQRYGVFPLRGKVMNVCDVGADRVAANAEIAALKKILGLQTGKAYAGVGELRYGRVMLMTDADSLTGDTPLLLRDPGTGQVEVRAIDDVADPGWAAVAGGKEYAPTRFEAWTERGWTRITRVMRHRTAKRVYRVQTPTGCVDVTEDHSLLDAAGRALRPADAAVGQALLHSFPPRFEGAPAAAQALGAVALGADEAWAMGLYWAAGGCGARAAWWISSARADLLRRAADAQRLRHPELTFSVLPDHDAAVARAFQPVHTTYKLVVNGGAARTASFVARYRELFHAGGAAAGQRRVPPLVLNAPAPVRRAFLDGLRAGAGDCGDYCAGGCDCCDGPPPQRFAVRGKLGAMGVYYLCRSLGHDAAWVDARADRPDEYAIYTAAALPAPAAPTAVRRVTDLGRTEQHVYDLETANHHFHAGVGQLIVHNTDGSHIRGLVMNLFAHQWPSLLRVDGFLCALLTPVVKSVHPRTGERREFYTTDAFEAWRAALPPADAGAWRSKYFKGLGTSTPEEARDWFREMRVTTFVWTDADLAAAAALAPVPEEEEAAAAPPLVRGCGDALSLAFNKKRADDRKAWLERGAPPAAPAPSPRVPFAEFVTHELIHFSLYDLQRSIPSAIDGLKVSQRKALFACFERNLVKEELRVAQLAAYAAERACFHHGEASMQGTIVGMAQDFVGSNNLPLLEPIGQFGSRLAGGQDAASARYIHTRLARLTRLLFPRADDAILEPLHDDGTPVQPRHYLPILPLVLVNGATGIGTGYSTSVPTHHPLDVVAATRAELARLASSSSSTAPPPAAAALRPWARGFRGAIEPRGGEAGAPLVSRGVVRREGGGAVVRVLELPLGVWTDDFKEALDAFAEAQPDVRGVANASFDTQVDFRITFASDAAAARWMAPPDEPAAGSLYPTRLEAALKLAGTRGLGTTNMHLFDAEGRIRRYEAVGDVVRAFVPARLAGYAARKAHAIAALERELDVLRNRAAFISAVVGGELALQTAEGDAELDAALEARGLARLVVGASEGGAPSYRYLTQMPLASLTRARHAELTQAVAKAEGELAALRATAPEALWERDLAAFEAAYREAYGADDRAAAGAGTGAGPSQATLARGPRRRF